MERAEALVPAGVLGMLRSKKWKERVEGMDGLRQFVMGLEDLPAHADLVVRMLSKVPGFKDSNFQVLSSVFQLIADVGEEVGGLPKPTAAVVVPGAVNKIGDVKVKVAAQSCLTSLCRSVGPQFVLVRLYKLLAEQRNVKNVAEGIDWMASVVTDFGLSQIKTSTLVQFAKKMVEHTNPRIKGNTVRLLCEIKRHVGDNLLQPLQDIKPALLETIKKEFEATPTDHPQPTETIKGKSLATPAAAPPSRAPPSGRQRAAAIEEDAGVQDMEVDEGNDRYRDNNNDDDYDDDELMDDEDEENLPRRDISSQLDRQLLRDLDHEKGKKRNEALKRIEGIVVAANRRIDPSGLEVLMPLLRKRCGDANKVVVTSALRVVGMLGEAGGPGMSAHVGILGPVLANVSDNKRTVRDATLTCLTQWHHQVSLGPILKHLCRVIAADNPTGREEVLRFLCARLAEQRHPQGTLSPLVQPLVAALQDRNAEVRRLAERVLEDTVENVGVDAMHAATRGLKPAIASSVNAVIDKHAPSRTNTQSQPQSQPQPQPQSQPVTSNGGLLVSNQLKEMRMKQEQQHRRWADGGAPHPELVEILKEQMMNCVLPDVHHLLFDSDLKRQNEAIAQLSASMHHQRAEMIESLDVLLKWASLRIFEANGPAQLSKTLQFVRDMLRVARDVGYGLSDYEASSLLPFLCERLGQNQERLCQDMRGAVTAMCEVYPPEKVMVFLLKGLDSRNARTRAELLSSMNDIIHRHGAHVLPSPPKAVRVIGQRIGDRDAMVREASLVLLSTLFPLVGTDEMWRYLERLEPQYKSMLEEHIQHTIGLDNRSAAQTQAVVDPAPMEVVEPRPAVDTHTMREEQRPATSGSVYDQDTQRIVALVDSLDASRTEESIAALRQLGVLLQEGPAVSLGGCVDVILPKVALALEAGFFAAYTDERAVRLCKYLLNTMMQIFSRREVVQQANSDALSVVVDQLLQRLLDGHLPHMASGERLLTALNTIMLKVLENSDRTTSFSALLQLLTYKAPDHGFTHKYTELVVKCLIKLTKTLAATIGNLRIDRILYDLHRFLTEHPPSKFRDTDDIPLRTVKTILNEIVKLRGSDVRSHLSMIPTQRNPLIVSYIELMLTSRTEPSQQHQHMAPPTSGAQQQHHHHYSHPIQRQPPPPTADVTGEFRGVLDGIFERVRTTEHTQQGLLELHRFTQQHPDVPLDFHMSRCSGPFQAYIRRQLQKLERETQQGCGAGQAAGSVGTYQEQLSHLKHTYGYNGNENSSATTTTTTTTDADADGQDISSIRNRLAHLRRQ